MYGVKKRFRFCPDFLLTEEISFTQTAG